MNQRIEITEAEYNELVAEQEAGNYTQFYLHQYEMGSDVCGLYVAGPTRYSDNLKSQKRSASLS